MTGRIVLATLIALPMLTQDRCGDPEPTTTTVTFEVDTNVLADGTNQLNAVDDGEVVFIAANFTAWNPNRPGYEMADPEGDGIWSITLTFPLDAWEYDGSPTGIPKTYNIGDTIEFKFAKTSSGPCDQSLPQLEPTCWSEGQKLFMTHDEAMEVGKVCREQDPIGGLWQLDPLNYSLVVPAEPTALMFVSEAWEATGMSYGYPLCD